MTLQAAVRRCIIPVPYTRISGTSLLSPLDTIVLLLTRHSSRTAPQCLSPTRSPLYSRLSVFCRCSHFRLRILCSIKCLSEMVRRLLHTPLILAYLDNQYLQCTVLATRGQLLYTGVLGCTPYKLVDMIDMCYPGQRRRRRTKFASGLFRDTSQSLLLVDRERHFPLLGLGPRTGIHNDLPSFEPNSKQSSVTIDW